MDRRIYLDHAATTPVREEAWEAMRPFLAETFGNPSAFYEEGQKAKAALMKARSAIAATLGVKENEIYFTSGGSEADNWALVGTFEASDGRGKHIITTAIEHHAVLETCRYLEKRGAEITYIGVDENGLVDPAEIERAIRPDTILISVMYANNEIGTIQPIREIGKIASEHGIVFHTDAVQAYTHLPIRPAEEGIDLLSVSGHKFGGPKGTGFLYIRNGIALEPCMRGGRQERGRRAGTENVSGIIGLAAAAKASIHEMEGEGCRERALRDAFMERILSEVPCCRVNGDRKKRLPGNINLCFDYIQGESALVILDRRGISASSGSACTSGALDPSHVLLAIGLSREEASGSIRLTIGRETTEEELKEAAGVLIDTVEHLRQYSDAYRAYMEEHE